MPQGKAVNTTIPLPDAGGASNDGSRARTLIERQQRAVSTRDQVKSIWDEVIEYTMPHRRTSEEQSEGDRRTDLIFDETAVVGTSEFVSLLVDGLTPNFSNIFKLQPGPRFPDELKSPELQRELDGITDYIHRVLRQSNFASEVQEFYYDLAIGTANMAIWDGGGPGKVTFSAESITDLVIDRGPNDTVDGRFRSRKVKLKHLKQEWPKAKLSDPLQRRLKNGDTDEVTVIEAFTRDWSAKDTETWLYEVVVKDETEVIHTDKITGNGSQPILTARWGKSPRDLYGRGPLMAVLPAIKTVNFLIELTIQNAQMAIGGVWQYDDDGVINPDQISFEPWSMIPRRVNSTGIEPLQTQARFDVSNLVVDDMRTNIRRGLFLEDFDGGGKTPISASEAVFRKQDNNRRMASAFGLFQGEFILPMIRRVVHLLRQHGVIELPRIDGQEIDLQVVSPLAQAQASQDIESLTRYLGTVGQAFGPDAVNFAVKQHETMTWLAQKEGVPSHLVPTQREIAKQIEQVKQAAQQVPTDQNGQPMVDVQSRRG